MAEIVNLSVVENDNTEDTIKNFLERVYEEIVNGEIRGTKFVFVALDAKGNDYDYFVRSNNIKKTEAIALLEIAKLDFASK